jgi:NAD(P)-dependent dehydrogenase (short-subunit alcohol dehydrogenase family)
VLVNNAGITHACDFLDLAEEDFDRVLAVNLKSMFLCGQAVARAMVKAGGGGSIVNMSSANAVVAIPNQVPYVVSKGGINQLTKVMAVALAPHGIRVNAMARARSSPSCPRRQC